MDISVLPVGGTILGKTPVLQVNSLSQEFSRESSPQQVSITPKPRSYRFIRFTVSCLWDIVIEVLTQFPTMWEECWMLWNTEKCRICNFFPQCSLLCKRKWARWAEAENLSLVIYIVWWKWGHFLNQKDSLSPRNSNFFIKIHVSLMADGSAHLII